AVSREPVPEVVKIFKFWEVRNMFLSFSLKFLWKALKSGLLWYVSDEIVAFRTSGWTCVGPGVNIFFVSKDISGYCL
ncbi:MAG TPA: hypothetical protein DCX92_05895, partial [Bacteroidetes bacterium]|nr:hypothetical protein [Bacteroidota bacterium]